MLTSTATTPATTTTLCTHQDGKSNLTGRMYSRHVTVPITMKEHRERDGAPALSFPYIMTQSMYASLSKVLSIISTGSPPRARIDVNNASKNIAADGEHLCQIHQDGLVFEYDAKAKVDYGRLVRVCGCAVPALKGGCDTPV